MMRKKITRTKVLAVVLLLFVSCVLHAQPVNNAVVTGKVTSESDDALAGVAIEVRSLDGKIVANTVTDQTGIFKINELTANSKYNFTFTHVGYEVNSLRSFLVRESNGNSIFIRLKEST